MLTRRTALAALILLIGGSALAALWARSNLWRDGPRHDAAQPTQAQPPSLEIPSRPTFARAESPPKAHAVAALRDECFDVAERLVSELPGNLHAVCLLGTVHHRHGNDAAATRLWDHCLQLDPHFADAHHTHGLRDLVAGDFAAAEEHLREAQRIDPAWEEIPLPLAQALASQGKRDEAARVLESFVGSHPESSEGWWRLGQAYYELKEYRNSERCYRAASEADPPSAAALYGRAKSLEKLGAAREAREQMHKFCRLRHEEDRTVRAARKSMTDEDRLRFRVVQTRMTAGRVCLMAGSLANAQTHFLRAAALDPQHRESRETLCDLYQRQERPADAVPIRQELCDLEPDNPRHWLSLGFLSNQTGRPAEAEEGFRRVNELTPRQADGYAALAQVQMLPDRNPGEAVELAKTAVDLAPTAPHHYVLATACWSAGERAAARAALEQAIRLDPADPRYREAYHRLEREQP